MTRARIILLAAALAVVSGDALAGASQAGAPTEPPRPNPNADPETIGLWEGSAPGALGNDDADRPLLTIYRAAGRQSSGTTVIVAPGGGYGTLAMNHEGRQLAGWFNAMGVTAFVLKYRLG